MEFNCALTQIENVIASRADAEKDLRKNIFERDVGSCNDDFIQCVVRVTFRLRTEYYGHWHTWGCHTDRHYQSIWQPRVANLLLTHLGLPMIQVDLHPSLVGGGGDSSLGRTREGTLRVRISFFFSPKIPILTWVLWESTRRCITRQYRQTTVLDPFTTNESGLNALFFCVFALASDSAGSNNKGSADCYTELLFQNTKVQKELRDDLGPGVTRTCLIIWALCQFTVRVY